MSLNMIQNKNKTKNKKNKCSKTTKNYLFLFKCSV